MVGLVLPYLTSTFYATIGHIIGVELSKRGYDLILSVGRDDVKLVQKTVRNLISRRVEGIIITPSRLEVERKLVLNDLHKQGIPMVILESVPDSDFCTVSTDDVQGSCDAVTHLIRKGARRIFYIAGMKDWPSSRERVEGYRKALDKHMKAAIAQGLMEWLEAVLALIPVWSGASRATFVKVARIINYSLPVGPASGSWAHGLFTSRMDRTGTGQAMSTGRMKTDGGEYSFTYGTSLPWLIWHEYHNANVDPDPTLFYRLLQPGPYNFQTAGAEAFRKFASRVTLLPVASYIGSKAVRA